MFYSLVEQAGPLAASELIESAKQVPYNCYTISHSNNVLIVEGLLNICLFHSNMRQRNERNQYKLHEKCLMHISTIPVLIEKQERIYTNTLA